MNTRNVDALAKEIVSCPSWGAGLELDAYTLAWQLAAGGVLEPGSLTDEEAMRVHLAGGGAHTFDPDQQRLTLRRIAQGDPA